MKKNLNALLKLTEKATSFAEQRVRKELGALAKSGLISRKDARAALKLAAREAKQEQQRIRKFIIAELKREFTKAKPLIKKVLAKKRKQFEQYRTLRRWRK